MGAGRGVSGPVGLGREKAATLAHGDPAAQLLLEALRTKKSSSFCAGRASCLLRPGLAVVAAIRADMAVWRGWRQTVPDDGGRHTDRPAAAPAGHDTRMARAAPDRERDPC